LFILFQYLDALRVKYTKILPILRKKNQILILDRYVYDIIFDLAVDTKQTNLVHSWFGRRFRNLLPDDAKILLVRRELDTVLKCRPEGVVDRNFEARYKHYQQLDESMGIHVLNNDGTLDELLLSAKKVTGLL